MIAKSKVKKLRKQLEGHSKQPVAEKTGKTEQYILRVLRGESYNEPVIEACIELRDNLKIKSQQIADRI